MAEMKKAVPCSCMLNACIYEDKYRCSNCGFDIYEDMRRKSIPITRDEDGLYRKHLMREA